LDSTVLRHRNRSCLVSIALQTHTQASLYAQISGGVVVLTVEALFTTHTRGRRPLGSTRPCPRFPTTHGTSRCSCCGLHVACCLYVRKESAAWRTRTCYCHSTMQLMREGHAADDLDNAALGSEALKCSVTPLATMNGIHKARFALCHHLAIVDAMLDVLQRHLTNIFNQFV